MLTLSVPFLVFAETNDAAKDPLSFDASLRTRYEFIDWFEAGAAGIDNSYSYPSLKGQLGVGYNVDDFKFYVQGEYDQVFDLPTDADNGPGVIYKNFNRGDRDPGSVYVRQGYAQFSNISDSNLSVTGGRILYSSGAEVKSSNKTIDWIKGKRIADRLIGPFDFTFGRSFDGARFDYKIADFGTFTAHLSHPTKGGFVTDGLKTITDISLLTAAMTHPYSFGEGSEGDAQLFYYGYDDERGAATVKTDNRPLDVRTGDIDDITIHNFGGHIIHTEKVGTGTWDGMLWGVFQTGDWGTQGHSAQALAVETGYRFDEVYGAPWLRAGFNWGSGDDDPSDGDHDTFFQMLPTARAYAMTPFYNSMNLQDFFVQVMWKPHEKVTLRSDFHFLGVSEENDLLYSGAGAGERSGPFGFAGAPTKGEDQIGQLLDFNIWVDLHKNASLYLYYGHLFSGDLTEAAFAESDDIDYGFIELTFKL